MEEWGEREVDIAADLREVDFAKSESSKPESYYEKVRELKG